MKYEYTCPRCEYSTPRKADMRTHLYNKKKVCSGIHKEIELTDEIKEEILANRIYTVPGAPTTVNNYYNSEHQFPCQRPPLPRKG